MSPGKRRPTLDLLADRLEQLESRLAQLENAPPRQDREAGRPPERAAIGLIDALSSRSGPRYERGDVVGALGYAGYLRVGERRYAWAQETGAADLLDADRAAVARWLGAIASPPRLALLVALLGRDRTSTELVSALGDPSPGQVYHHLKELQATGILVQVRRGVYRISPPVLVPLLIVLAAATDSLAHRPMDSPGPPPTEM